MTPSSPNPAVSPTDPTSGAIIKLIVGRGVNFNAPGTIISFFESEPKATEIPQSNYANRTEFARANREENKQRTK